MAVKWAVDLMSYLLVDMLHTEASYRECKSREKNAYYYLNGILHQTKVVENSAQAEEEVNWINSQPPIKTHGNWNRSEIEKQKSNIGGRYTNPQWAYGGVAQIAKYWAIDTKKYLVGDRLHTEADFREAKPGEKSIYIYKDGIVTKTEIVENEAQAQEEVREINLQPSIETYGNWNRDEIEKQNLRKHFRRDKFLLWVGKKREYEPTDFKKLAKTIFKILFWTILFPVAITTYIVVGVLSLLVKKSR